tara:strand:+ start:140 stop:1012 length:873 start_codon:yes stop_codon:yes gene_type:complete
MSTPRDTPFTKPNSNSQYGKTPLESWVGTVVSYDAQKEQIEGGWGWRYKVRIMGDNTNTDQITDQQLSYAYVLLPTTAGSGGAFKMRSVRISQGDFVYGVRGGGSGAPTMILGVFPRTSQQSSGSGNFANTSGFTGGLKKTKTLSGEFNEQKGPATPNVTPLDPKEQNLSNRPDLSGNVETIGYDTNDDAIIDNAEEKLTPPTTDPSTPWEVGDPITKGQLEYILNGVKNPPDPNYDYTDTQIVAAISQANEQNLISESLAETATNKLNEGDGAVVNSILFPPPPPIVPS